eukprot:Lithocolla_globosa_v1_NODE_1989_length_2226_cov_3.643943.p2 type:complete len:314 gc:universal NODE_1989_length_2226_cov_3.643943:951-10(-)
MRLLALFVAGVVGLREYPGSYHGPKSGVMREDLTESIFKIGPFIADASGNPNKFARPAPDKKIDIAHWGDFFLVDEDGDIIGAEELYQHHLFVHNSNYRFLTGMSNERTTWGPNDLPEPYHLVMEPGEDAKITSFHIVNQKNTPNLKYWIQYTVKWRLHKEGQVKSLECIQWADQTWNIPGGGSDDSIHSRTFSKEIPYSLEMVSAQSHLHQGGWEHVLEEVDTGNVLCRSVAHYGPEPCSWDCDLACPWDESHPADPTLAMAYNWQPVCYPMTMLEKGTSVKFTAYFDNECTWHGVMSWFFFWVYDTSKGLQ